MDKIIIVGAGLSGATVARLFADSGMDVTVVDKRATIGGNAYDYVDKNGITVQPYGPHIFHTTEKEVFDFLSKFTEWNAYEHKVLANVKGKLIPVPFNLTSLYACFSKSKAERIYNVLTKEVGENKQVSILRLKEHKNAEIRDFADFVYNNIFYKYTRKQWKMKPEDLGEAVMSRVPVYVSYEDRYFTDDYQFMPKKGFTEMITNMLRHPHIRLKLDTDAERIFSFEDGKIYLEGKEFDGIVVYTGRIEEIFGYKFGALPYRTLKFKFKTFDRTSFQKAAVVNYTTSHKFTRITEFTKFTCEPKDKTVIVKEYSKKCKKGDMPYYPVPTEKNCNLYEKYKTEAAKYKKLYLLGRLADYKYINMDVAVLNAMKMHKKIMKENVFED
ncbi:MAG: UDP-galactopyranose mutase [Clostridia bacterium]|nr:UDP-galactopyranose mutase [Clostridia bacterium]